MALFTKESLESLRQKVDLVDLLSSHIELKRAGAGYKALCPFHEEKTPSFVIQRGDTHYHCFGCGAHGDGLQFLMDYLKLSFPEAVEMLSERFHIPLERVEEGKKDSSTPKIKKALLEANKLFHLFLLHTEEGHKALDYLYSRGFSLAFIERYQLGYAPSSKYFFSFLQKKQIPQEIAEKAGLTMKGPKGSRFLFSERITIPIHSPTGTLIGFSARKLREETFGGKYVNTPETSLFKKSSLLFGLNHARRSIAKEKKALLVEGQLDALRLQDAGFSYAVASQGTAFGLPQAELLYPLGVQDIYLAFDADRAGREAMCKIGDFFQKEGIEVHIVSLPYGKDPDTILCERGPQAFRSLMEHSKDYLHFLVETHSLDHPLNSPASKDHLARKLSALIQAWKHPVMVHESLKKLAALLNVPPQTLGVHRFAPTQRVQRNTITPSLRIDPQKVLESDMLRWLILEGERTPTLLSLCKLNLSEEDFTNASCKKVYETYMSLAEKKQSLDPLSLAAELEEGQCQELLTEILERKVNKDKAWEGAVQTVQKLLDRRWLDKKEKIKIAIHEGSQSSEEVFKLVREYNSLNKTPPSVALPQA